MVSIKLQETNNGYLLSPTYYESSCFFFLNKFYIVTNYIQIERVSTAESESGDAAWLGTGAIWGDVLRLLISGRSDRPQVLNG